MDSSFEIQGYRILAHDNGDETFSPVVTTSTGVGDQTLEWQGLRLKIHPTGQNVTIGGVVTSTYAIVVSSL
jgi:hypothetical protein